MKRIALLISLAGLGVAATARANQFDFTWTGQQTDATGVLNATNNNNGSFTVTGGSLSILSDTSHSVLGNYSVIPGAGNNGIYIYDNQLFPTSNPAVDNGGLLFGNHSGQQINIYSVGTQDYLSASTGSIYNPGDPGTLSVNAVPESAPFAILGLGVISVFFRERRKRN